ncbi:hypothetical protein HDV57DRAFT_390771 [Trichoderma longibrachiatum]|uniref:Uncharacterized protein n=1 Tax=Trichoderma longibrachiatum ATCC 18648 TaxID=983965 RepID=A0A2T4C3T6_TRILO|nr:hypothetical protein M440DRAFT_1247801 [Trichoderma longibrachiatum ATCC 18648]
MSGPLFVLLSLTHDTQVSLTHAKQDVRRYEVYKSIQCFFQHLNGVPSRAIPRQGSEGEGGNQNIHSICSSCETAAQSDTLDIQRVVRQRVKRHFFPHHCSCR